MTRPVEANGLGNSIDATSRLVSRPEIFFTIWPETLEYFYEWKRLVSVHGVKGAKVHDARLLAVMNTYRLNCVLTFNIADFARCGAECLDPRALPAEFLTG